METARSAIVANQIAQDIVANNLANSETTGYTRQRVERAVVAINTHSNRVASSYLGNSGAGVTVQGVSQIRDSFLDKCFRDEYAISSTYGQTANMLEDILGVFPDGADITDDSGLIGALKQLYTNFNTFIMEPTSDSEANLVRSSFTNIAQILQQLDAGLNTVRQRQTDDLQVTVDRANELFRQIADLNISIAGDAAIMANANSTYFQPNALLDQRNLLLDELSSYGAINVKNHDDGTVTVEMGGRTVVEKGKSDALALNVDNNHYVDVVWRTSGQSINLTGGTISAYVNVLNGRGNNLQSDKETSTQGIPYYRDRINGFASALAVIANNTIPETDASGTVIGYKTLLSGFNADGTKAGAITAANISISDEWIVGGPGYIVYSKEEGVEDYIQLLSNRIFEESTTFEAYGERFRGTFSNYVIDMVGKLGTDISFNQTRRDATATIADDFLASRDSISGVQRDEETANMLVFQKAYQAAARMMTVMDEMLDVLINGMGIVGR
jgi:flagellar hook-associated protein 1 FlgK